MILDVIILFVLAFFAFRSFKGGLQDELLGTVGWILAFAIAVTFYLLVSRQWIAQWPALKEIAPIASFLVVMIAARILVTMIVKLAPNTESGLLYMMQKILSVAFGLIKGMFFVGIILLLLAHSSSTQEKMEKAGKDSILYSHISKFPPTLVRLMVDKIPNMDAFMNIWDK